MGANPVLARHDPFALRNPLVTVCLVSMPHAEDHFLHVNNPSAVLLLGLKPCSLALRVAPDPRRDFLWRPRQQPAG